MGARTGAPPPHPRLVEIVGEGGSTRTTHGSMAMTHGKETGMDATMMVVEAVTTDGATVEMTDIAYMTMEDSEALPGQMVETKGLEGSIQEAFSGIPRLMVEITDITYMTVEDSKVLPGQMVETVALGYMIKGILIAGLIPMWEVQIPGLVLKGGKAMVGGNQTKGHNLGGLTGTPKTTAKDPDPQNDSQSPPSPPRTPTTWATPRGRTSARLRFGAA